MMKMTMWCRMGSTDWRIWKKYFRFSYWWWVDVYYILLLFWTLLQI